MNSLNGTTARVYIRYIKNFKFTPLQHIGITTKIARVVKLLDSLSLYFHVENVVNESRMSNFSSVVELIKLKRDANIYEN